MLETDIYDSAEYKRSRKAYTLQCAFEYFVAIMAGDAFLAKLLSAIGISDSLIGIISSFTTLAFFVSAFHGCVRFKNKKYKENGNLFQYVNSGAFWVSLSYPAFVGWQRI